LLGNIPKLDITLEYFSSGTIAQSLKKVAKDHHPLYLSFFVWGEIFPPPIGIENLIAPLVLSSLWQSPLG